MTEVDSEFDRLAARRVRDRARLDALEGKTDKLPIVAIVLAVAAIIAVALDIKV